MYSIATNKGTPTTDTYYGVLTVTKGLYSGFVSQTLHRINGYIYRRIKSSQTEPFSPWQEFATVDTVTKVPVNLTLHEIDGGSSPILLTLPSIPTKWVDVFTTMGTFHLEGKEGLEFQFKQSFVFGVQDYGCELRIGVNWSNGIMHYGLTNKGINASWPTIKRIEYV